VIDLVIRLALAEDMPFVKEVAIASYEHTFAEFNTRENMDAFYAENYTLEKFEKEYHEPNSVVYLACRNKEIIGFVRLRINPEVNQYLGNNTIELQRLYIHPQHQGMRAGAKLMEAALEHSIKGSFEWIWLGVWEKNFKAQQFYEKFGFIKFGEHVFQMGDDPQIDWLLKLKL
jgi:diamine N-acetyltransferase